MAVTGFFKWESISISDKNSLEYLREFKVHNTYKSNIIDVRNNYLQRLSLFIKIIEHNKFINAI